MASHDYPFVARSVVRPSSEAGRYWHVMTRGVVVGSTRAEVAAPLGARRQGRHRGVSRTQRPVRMTTAVLALLLAWNGLPGAARSLAEALGATPGSFLDVVIVDGLLPLLIAALVALAVRVYDNLYWPRWDRTYQGGWWVYALIAHAEGGEQIPIVGGFFLDHRPDSVSISEGRAYYADGPSLVRRGDWVGDTAWLVNKQLSVLFRMHGVRIQREPMPSRYEGLFTVRFLRSSPVAGVSGWTGHFQDLEDRSSVGGPVYAEYLGRQHRKASLDKVDEVLMDQFRTLLARVPA